MFLRYCWQNILARSNLLREADVAVFLNPSDTATARRYQAMELLRHTFAHNPNLKVYLRAPQRKQDGANGAMYDAIASGFFSDYDWIIRVNPDVIVRDDSFLIESMSDPSISALLINCDKKTVNTHTDFFALRPQVLSTETFPKDVKYAEYGFRKAITKSVLDKKGSYRWIEDSSPKRNGCRAGNGRDYFESSIVHVHTLHPDMCEIPENDVNANANVTELLGTEWPYFWMRI